MSRFVLVVDWSTQIIKNGREPKQLIQTVIDVAKVPHIDHGLNGMTQRRPKANS